MKRRAWPWRWGKRLALAAVGQPWLRAKLCAWLREVAPGEFRPPVLLGDGLGAPWFDHELATSFAEIFVGGEYAGLLGREPLPARWLDLGCYGGFFTLWLVAQRRRAGLPADFAALLVDGDPTHLGYVGEMIRLNRWEGRCRFRHGAIAAGPGAVGGGATVDFALRPYMGSAAVVAAAGPGDGSATVRVPVLDEDELRRCLPPPYDLVKVDIEGGEFAFFQHYRGLLRETRALVMEWHSWHAGGGGLGQLVALARELGFGPPVELGAARDVGGKRPPERCGVVYFVNERGLGDGGGL